jgi:hypothetical protein
MKEPTEAPAEQAARPSQDAPHAEDMALARRAASHVLTVHAVRLTDDPEMLELILAGLLSLP